MILKILLYGLLIYLAYKYVVLPLFGGKNGASKRGSNMNYRKKKDIQDHGKGEYIDYEEVNDND